jgi:hypothetical protein
MSDNPGFNAEDLVWVVVGVLYSTGHQPITLNEQSMKNAITAASSLLSAIGLTPARRSTSPREE